MRLLVLVLLAVSLLVSSEVKYICVRWAWEGDVFERRVYCLEWKRVEK